MAPVLSPRCACPWFPGGDKLEQTDGKVGCVPFSKAMKSVLRMNQPWQATAEGEEKIQRMHGGKKGTLRVKCTAWWVPDTGAEGQWKERKGRKQGVKGMWTCRTCLFLNSPFISETKS